MSSAKTRRCVAIALASLVAVTASACGGDDAETGGGAESSGQSRQGFAQDPEVAECLEKQGVELAGRPEGAPPQGEPPQGTPPADGEPPSGGPPGGGGFGGDSEQAQKLRDALEKCGVDMPQRPQGGESPEASPEQ